MVIYGDLWWFMVIYGDLWWFMVIYGDLMGEYPLVSWDLWWFFMGFYSDLMGYEGDIPSGYVKIAIENGHWNSEFSQKKWWFSIAM